MRSREEVSQMRSVENQKESELSIYGEYAKRLTPWLPLKQIAGWFDSDA